MNMLPSLLVPPVWFLIVKALGLADKMAGTGV